MSIKRRFCMGVVLAILAVLAGSLAMAKVKTAVNPKLQLSSYKTYQWLAPRVLKKTGVSENDEVIAPIIKSAVNRELTRRGLTEVATGGDLQISSWALGESVPRVDALIYTGGATYGAGSFIDPVSSSVASIGGYSSKEGTLVINLIDPKVKASAWAAMAKTSYKDLSKLNGKIDKMITEMFKQYPIQPR